MRYNTFSRKVVTLSSFVTPERLPPTESAIKFHYHRAYYQIMTWIWKEDGMYAVNWDGARRMINWCHYVANDCCSRQSLEGHSLQLLQCLQDISLSLQKIGLRTATHCCVRTMPTSELWQSEEQICARWPGSWRWSALGVLLSDDLTLKSTVFFVMSPCALVTCQLSNSRLLNVDLLFHFLFSNG